MVVKNALVLSKNTHKDQIGSKPGKRGKSGQFFDSIWYRLHDKFYTGRDCSEAVEVAIDLIGPWKVKVNGRMCEFNALTCIDTASNLVELIRIDNKTAEHIRNKFVW